MSKFSLTVLCTSPTPGDILDNAVEEEERKHGDFLRLVTFRFFFLT